MRENTQREITHARRSAPTDMHRQTHRREKRRYMSAQTHTCARTQTHTDHTNTKRSAHTTKHTNTHMRANTNKHTDRITHTHRTHIKRDRERERGNMQEQFHVLIRVL